MGINTFKNYGFLAEMSLSYTETSGRFNSQIYAERLILGDVISKLKIQPTDTLLDIGCGSGLILLPISFIVSKCVGIDHPSVIKLVSDRLKSDQIELIGGDFLSICLGDRKFNKIICYGVIQNLLNKEELLSFISKALSHLEEGGIMLLGDVSNVDKKRRFQSSARGQQFEKEWEKISGSSKSYDDSKLLPDIRIEFTDELVLDLIGHIRKSGFHAYVIDQPATLPWGNTREDILVVSP